MLLHLFHDEKFVDSAIALFEAVYPGGNTYLLGVHASAQNLKYVGSTKNVIVAPYGSSQYSAVLSRSRDCRGVLVHFLDHNKEDAIAAIPSKAKLVWMIWGGDAYCMTKIGLYDRQTAALLSRISGKNSLTRALKSTKLYPLYCRLQRRRTLLMKRKILRRFDIVTTVVPNEYDFFRSELSLRAGYAPFSYASIEYFLSSISMERTINGGNILLGNSGDPSNNHISILETLTENDIAERNLIVPLNYGCSASYREAVILTGCRRFGRAFRPLTEFLPLSEYLKVIRSCSFCFMNHYRQQGMGNIVFLLWMGARVYLRKENLISSYLKQNGVIVSDIEEIHSKGFVLIELTSGEKKRNREIVERLYDRQVVLQKARQLIEALIR
jgi:dTDP-N-acetylfucosamine:lipid II N-acetylfucosaminyltransferase